MSSAAIVWAWKAPVESCYERCLLLALAEQHDELNPDGIFYSIGHLEVMTKISRRTLFRCLDRLENAGLIKRVNRFSGGVQRSSIYRLIDVPPLVPKGCHTDTPPCHTDTPPVSERHTDSLTVTPSLPRKTRKREARFAPPTVEEVEEYCRERGNDIDAQAFWAHYESKGWKVGKAPMKSWKAAVITWERTREADRKHQPRAGKQTRAERGQAFIDRLDRRARDGGY